MGCSRLFFEHMRSKMKPIETTRPTERTTRKIVRYMAVPFAAGASSVTI